MVSSLTEGGEIIEHIGDRILGRVALDDILDPVTGECWYLPMKKLTRHWSKNRRCRTGKGEDSFRA